MYFIFKEGIQAASWAARSCWLTPILLKWQSLWHRGGGQCQRLLVASILPWNQFEVGSEHYWFTGKTSQGAQGVPVPLSWRVPVKPVWLFAVGATNQSFKRPGLQLQRAVALLEWRIMDICGPACWICSEHALLCVQLVAGRAGTATPAQSLLVSLWNKTKPKRSVYF